MTADISRLTAAQLAMLADVAAHGVRHADAAHSDDLRELERHGLLISDADASYRLTRSGHLLAHLWKGLPMDPADPS